MIFLGISYSVFNHNKKFLILFEFINILINADDGCIRAFRTVRSNTAIVRLTKINRTCSDNLLIN